MASREAHLHEVLGKTRDDGRIYDTHLCLKCGMYVVYLPIAMCGKCGYLKDSEFIKVPETYATEAREAIKEAGRKLASHYPPTIAH